MLDRLHLAGVRRDFDLVALGAIEVADHVVAEAVDPVIVDVVVLAGDAGPVDGAVGVDVLGDDLVRGVDHKPSKRKVSAPRPPIKVSLTALNAAVSSAKICVVPSCAATISPASERLSRTSLPVPPSIRSAPKPPTRRSAPVPPERLSLPEPPQTLSSPEPPSSVSLPAIPATCLRAGAAEQHVVAGRAVQMIMVGTAAVEPGEKILEAAIVEEAVQIEACHLFKPLTQRPHEIKTTTTDFGNREVMRAGRT